MSYHRTLLLCKRESIVFLGQDAENTLNELDSRDLIVDEIDCGKGVYGLMHKIIHTTMGCYASEDILYKIIQNDYNDDILDSIKIDLKCYYLIIAMLGGYFWSDKPNHMLNSMDMRYSNHELCVSIYENIRSFAEIINGDNECLNKMKEISKSYDLVVKKNMFIMSIVS